MSDFPIGTGADSEVYTDFQVEELFASPFIGLTAAIGWVAHRTTHKAFEVGFWRFCDISVRDRLLFAAKEELWRALQKGGLPANGVDDRGDCAEIPALDWRFLEFASGVDCVVTCRDSTRRYSSVAVETQALLREFPKDVKLPPAPAVRDSARGQGRPSTSRDKVLKYLEENFRTMDDVGKHASIAAELKVSPQTVGRAIKNFRFQK